MPKQSNQLVRFLLVGVTNTVISYLVFILAYYLLFSRNTLLAQPFSYSAGIAWSYYWNRKWTFQSNNTIHHEFLKFISVQILLLLLSTVALHLLIDYWGLNANVSWLFIMSLITVLNFILSKAIVFSIRK